MNTDSLLNEAIKAYFDDAEVNNLNAQQPAIDLCKVGRKYVHLLNNYGLLAKYDFVNKCFV